MHIHACPGGTSLICSASEARDARNTIVSALCHYLHFVGIIAPVWIGRPVVVNTTVPMFWRVPPEYCMYLPRRSCVGWLVGWVAGWLA